MTDQEKIEAYEDVAAIVADSINLEKHFRAQGKDSTDEIQLLRAGAWGEVVKRLKGRDVLPGLPI